MKYSVWISFGIQLQHILDLLLEEMGLKRCPMKEELAEIRWAICVFDNVFNFTEDHLRQFFSIIVGIIRWKSSERRNYFVNLASGPSAIIRCAVERVEFQERFQKLKTENPAIK